jgi:hypothetical protein
LRTTRLFLGRKNRAVASSTYRRCGVGVHRVNVPDMLRTRRVLGTCEKRTDAVMSGRGVMVKGVPRKARVPFCRDRTPSDSCAFWHGESIPGGEREKVRGQRENEEFGAWHQIDLGCPLRGAVTRNNPPSGSVTEPDGVFCAW